MKYFIHTYGCQMNVHESEKLAGVLEKLGYSQANNVDNADVIVFNTCAIRESAEQKIVGNIGDIKKIKLAHPEKIIAVCGCMTQQSEYPEKLRKKFAFIDIIFGTHNIVEFEQYLLDARNSHKKITKITECEDIDKRDKMPIYRTSGVNAWVNISYGCNNFCTYCIVPYVRGREVSREFNSIILDVKKLINEGYKQVTLLGQNVNSYGNDFNDSNINFANLLREIDKITGEFRLRFMTSHPKDLSYEVLDVMASSKHICHSLHLPVQSGSNNILKAMNRKYTTEKYLDTLNYARKVMPDIQFTSDFIVGFPGETEQDFEDTCKLVRKVRYQNLFMFMYSKRRGTVAEKMQNQIPISVKRERIAKLIDIEREIGSEISSTYIGKIEKVLIEGVNPKDSTILMGSLDCGKTISFKGDVNQIGQFINVKITKSKLTTLFGEIV